MPTAPSLPAGSTIGLSYEYGLDVNLGTDVAPVWQPVRRISNFQPSPTPKTQTSQTYDDFGADNADVVGWTSNLSFAVQVNRSASTGLYLPEIEAILARTGTGAVGTGAVIDVRWYHKPAAGAPNPNDAGRGVFTVAAQRANTGADGAVETLNVTLTGKGSYTKIANPFTGWAVAAPAVASITPAAAVAGTQVVITGTGFSTVTTAAANVKFGATNASAFTVLGDSTIVATMPAGIAGAVNVVITNPTGASPAFSYTRGA